MDKYLELCKCWDVITDNQGTTDDNLFKTEQEAISYACSLHERDRKNISSIREIWGVTDGNALAMCYGAQDAKLDGVCNSCDYNGNELDKLELEVIKKHGYTIDRELREGLPRDIDDLDTEAVYHFDGHFLKVMFNSFLFDDEEEEAGFELEELSNCFPIVKGKKYYGSCTLDDIVQLFASRYGADFVLTIA